VILLAGSVSLVSAEEAWILWEDSGKPGVFHLPAWRVNEPFPTYETCIAKLKQLVTAYKDFGGTALNLTSTRSYIVQKTGEDELWTDLQCLPATVRPQ
jgi:hypothetical protein